MKRSKISKTRREKVFKRDGHMCTQCFTPWNLTIDHLLPVSRGGTNSISNLVTMCSDCNKSKGRRDGTKVVDYELVATTN
jgi:5-methylcytosine-specific restriction endonuclease McrA